MSKQITVVSAGIRLPDGSRRTGQERDLVATVEVGAFTMFRGAELVVSA
ncbi:hypothetical protein [Streptomyces sp. ME18-1-4]|nr:hypothetical protein [Streptomyces sp. ME18-1-4]MDX3242097.1 hypothetical protein [Streptomyces sp. ME18-1-4]